MKDNKTTQQGQQNQPASGKQNTNQQQPGQASQRVQETEAASQTPNKQGKSGKQPVSVLEQKESNNEQTKPADKQTRQPRN